MLHATYMAHALRMHAQRRIAGRVLECQQCMLSDKEVLGSLRATACDNIHRNHWFKHQMQVGSVTEASTAGRRPDPQGMSTDCFTIAACRKPRKSQPLPEAEPERTQSRKIAGRGACTASGVTQVNIKAHRPKVCLWHVSMCRSSS